ncbi:PfkB family carbohydrate kinase [Defluviitalea phaphyphila]|uniref:PfkB family carbohydrate kinase n=1 Tax=Defluviitalea phaphyphila TaxID=1473580 RepID=UPI000A419DC4|nr:PfkB family carbohydrate kinase [Defluviitalea phaphyphila]
MDFSNNYSEEYLKQCSPYLDCVCLSCGDKSLEEILKLINDIKNYGCKHIIIATRGSLGAIVMVDGKIYEQSPCLVKPLDTMGAGDSFITCFLVNYIEGMKNVTDFPSQSQEKGLVSIRKYQKYLVKSALYKAAIYSANNCLKEGSFGYGIEF